LATGPDLAGVARRFSRDDLVAAVVEPERDVPDRYRTTTITTRSGRTYFGIVVYEAADSCLMLLQTGETVRIDPDDVEERRSETASLMPSGLLDSATDEEIADLFAYLASLDGPGSP
jgi:putative heme-binding domain-containing protein